MSVVSVSDLATKIAAATPASGNVFRTIVNADGTLQVLRAPGPNPNSFQWSILYGRVVYDQQNSRVLLSDGPSVAVSDAQAFVNGLN